MAASNDRWWHRGGCRTLTSRGCATAQCRKPWRRRSAPPGIFPWRSKPTGSSISGPNRLDGELINLPIRAVCGSAWTGEEMNFSNAPAQYAAIHFLEDALYDCGWETDFELEVPVGTPSGVYAAHLVSGGQEDHIPFFIRPPRDRASAPLAVARAHRKLHGVRQQTRPHGPWRYGGRCQPPHGS